MDHLYLKMKRAIYFIILIIFSILYFILIYTSSADSDYLLYAYKFSLNPLPDVPWPLIHERVNSVGDIIYSQYVHYLNVNGRSIVHAFVQFFSSFIRYDVCCLIATIVFIVTLLLCQKLCFKYNKWDWLPRFVCVVAIFVFCCSPASIFCIVGAINYLWPIAFCTSFVLLFNKTMNIWGKVLFYIIAFMAGWSHEAIAIPVAASFFCYLIIERKSIKPNQLVGILLLMAGTVVTVCAPGNFVKLADSHGGNQTIMIVINQHLYMFVYLRVTYVMLVLVGYLAFKRKLYLFIITHKYWFIAFVSSIAFVLLVGAINPRSTFFIEMIAGGLLCVYIDENWSGLMQQRLIYGCSVIILPMLLAAFFYRASIKENLRRAEHQIATSPEMIVSVDIQRVKVPFFLAPIVGDSQDQKQFLVHWRNIVYKFVYQKEEVNLHYID